MWETTITQRRKYEYSEGYGYYSLSGKFNTLEDATAFGKLAIAGCEEVQVIITYTEKNYEEDDTSKETGGNK